MGAAEQDRESKINIGGVAHGDRRGPTSRRRASPPIGARAGCRPNEPPEIRDVLTLGTTSGGTDGSRTDVGNRPADDAHRGERRYGKAQDRQPRPVDGEL